MVDGRDELTTRLIEEIQREEENETQDFLDLLSEHKPRVGRAVQLYLSGGFSVPKIADILGVADNTVRRWFAKDEIKNFMAEYQKREAEFTRARLRAKATDALETMADLLSSPIDGVRLSAAKDLMDRAGFKPIQESKKEVTVKTFEQQLATLADVDVYYEEVNDED